MAVKSLSVLILVAPKAKTKRLSELSSRLSLLDQEGFRPKVTTLELESKHKLTCTKLDFEEYVAGRHASFIRRADMVLVYKAVDEDHSKILDAISKVDAKKAFHLTTGEQGAWDSIVSRLKVVAGLKKTSDSAQTLNSTLRLKKAESRYGSFWQVKSGRGKAQRHGASQSDAKKIIRKILVDYSKYSRCGSWFSWLKRATTFHLNRHHTAAVSQIIAKMDCGELGSIDSILTELNKITRSKGFNHTGSLSMRISSIKAHLKDMSGINAQLLADEDSTINPSCFARY